MEKSFSKFKNMFFLKNDKKNLSKKFTFQLLKLIAYLFLFH